MTSEELKKLCEQKSVGNLELEKEYQFFNDNFSVEALSKVQGKDLAIRLFSDTNFGKSPEAKKYFVGNIGGMRGYFIWAEHNGIGKAGINKTINIQYGVTKDSGTKFFLSSGQEKGDVDPATAIDCATSIKDMFRKIVETAGQFDSQKKLNNIEGYRELNDKIFEIVNDSQYAKPKNRAELFYSRNGISPYILFYLHCHFKERFATCFSKDNIGIFLQNYLNETIPEAENPSLIWNGKLSLCANELGVANDHLAAVLFEQKDKDDSGKKSKKNAPTQTESETQTETQTDMQQRSSTKNEHELNLILYGPPGTGKTYKTVKYAVEIIEKEEFKDDGYESIKSRYDRLVKEGRIAFTTFHQSYGYEEFIEGIKPDFEADEIKYQRADGVFKAFCDKARKLKSDIAQKYEITESSVVWKMSLGRSDDQQIKRDCFAHDRIRLGWGASYDPQQAETTEYVGEGKRIVNAFLNEMKKGDIVFSFLSATTIDAIGVILEDEARYGEWDSYKWYRKVYWLKKGVNVDISALNDNKRMVQPTLYKLGIAIDSALSLLKDSDKNTDEDFDYDTPYVFIIDEINRGNVSKIFGELITLIEPSKRLGNPEAMTARLPYSGKDFGVPKNVYILGTMNTADRSLVQLDTALRRRFAFEEMMPDYEVIKEKVGVVEGIDIAKLLRTINDRITALLDREHQIGHSYFLGVESVQDLAEVFKKKILPLLQEYFFDNYQSIKDILNEVFVTNKTVQVGGKQKTLYEINIPETAEDYLKIYSQTNANENATEQNAA